MAITVGSLFSGIGGIDLGLERAGMDTRWFVEIDPHCRNVLRRHWPGVPVYGDITAVDWSGVEPVDVLVGGFPCQPVSNAGKRLGTDDARWLWPEFARSIRALRPRYVLVENVAALLGRGFEYVITDLAALGYDAEWDCIPAAAVGAPHLRDRLWIVAYARGEQHESRSPTDGGARAAQLHAAMADANRGGPQPVGVARDVPRAARGTERAARQRQRGGHATGDRGEVVADTSPRGRRARERDVQARQPDTARSGSALADSDRIARDEGRPGDATQEPRGRNADRGRVSGPVPHAIFAGLEGHERGVMALQDFRRFNADPAGSGWWAVEPDMGRVADGVPHRVDRLRALGNAVVPQVVEWIGRRIVAFDEGWVAA